MKRTKNLFAAAALCFAVANPAFADEDDDHDLEHQDIELGQDNQGKLGVIALPDEPIFLEPVDNILLTGWSAAEPGLFEVEAPEDGLSPLDDFSNEGIILELALIDFGLLIIEQGFGAIADEIGESVALGTESGLVHTHPTWAIDSDVVGPDFEGTLSATFILVDTNNNYANSDRFTLEFTNVPEPGSAMLLLAGAGLLAARRRRA